MKTTKKFQILFERSMIQHANKSTATTIDNIISNSIIDNDFESAIIKTVVSDHFPIIFIIELKTTFSPKNHADQTIYKRDFNENSLNLFKLNLFETSWDSLKNIVDPSQLYHKFQKIFSSLYEKYFPLTKVKLKPKRKNSHWISTSNHVLGRSIWDKLPECIFENFEIAQVKRRQFQIFISRVITNGIQMESCKRNQKLFNFFLKL